MPIALNQKRVAFWATAALFHEVMHVSDVDIVHVFVQRGFLRLRQDFVAGCRQIRHLKIGLVGFEIKGNIIDDFPEYQTNQAFARASITTHSAIIRRFGAIQRPVFWTACQSEQEQIAGGRASITGTNLLSTSQTKVWWQS